ncbi:hypothetical protein PQE71_gp041 [Bacillus phage Izhevsk]|uniref:Rubredoxin-like domain-containing protein n=1 Tax=Bacillus phage Izhevsk TaxID=2724322 RepID=A0A6H0X607_9CAUD|nr:hypothetical protein PQE71_gp041 [Bacillus phage Izhevsk]QIW89723.1 hypothetical protein Izhevsk_41 [Bacillus phage Izhevsk]
MAIIWKCAYCGEEFQYKDTVICPECGSDDTDFHYDEEAK